MDKDKQLHKEYDKYCKDYKQWYESKLKKQLPSYKEWYEWDRFFSPVTGYID